MTTSTGTHLSTNTRSNGTLLAAQGGPQTAEELEQARERLEVELDNLRAKKELLLGSYEVR